MRRSFAFVAVGFVVCGLLIAQTTAQYEYTAVVAGRALKQGSVKAGGITWNCVDNQCTVTGPWPTPGLVGCATLAQLVGRLQSYGHPSKQMDAAALTECNAKAPEPGGGTATREVVRPASPPSVKAPAVQPSARPPAAPAPPGLAGHDFDRDGHDSDENGGDDCDDRDSRRYPGNTEVVDPEGRDEDCRPETFGSRDEDADGYFDVRGFNRIRGRITSQGSDCDDGTASTHPTQIEVCNLIDDDCDGQVDEGVKLVVWLDRDHDLFGAPGTDIAICPMQLGPGYVTNNFDCDDTNAKVNPYFGNCR